MITIEIMEIKKVSFALINVCSQQTAVANRVKYHE